MSILDDTFIEHSRDILENGFKSTDTSSRVRGIWADTNEPAHTIKKFGMVNRYDLSKEFPISTLRPTAFEKCIDEILWIWQKKSNVVSDLNSKIWDQWKQEDGTIGKAYGYQLAKKHIYSDGNFDQVDRILKDLKEDPNSRRMITNMYNHEDLHDMALYPCAYSLSFNITGDKLNCILNQRSQDMLVANGWNVTQYAVLMHMFAQVSNLKVGILVHCVVDAHIYDRHVPLVKELIGRVPFKAPVFKINTAVKDLYSFKVDDFELVNYVCHDQIKNIPVAK